MVERVEVLDDKFLQIDYNNEDHTFLERFFQVITNNDDQISFKLKNWKHGDELKKAMKHAFENYTSNNPTP